MGLPEAENDTKPSVADAKTVPEVSAPEANQVVAPRPGSDPPPSLSLQECHTRLLSLLFRYGLLSREQIVGLFPDAKMPDAQMAGCLEIMEISDTQIYLHSEKSLKLYAKLSGIGINELSAKAVVASSIKEEGTDVAAILREIDMLLAFEKAAEKSKTYQLFDWVSAQNPRKKRMLKIKRVAGKRGCLQPCLLVVLKKKGHKFGLLLDAVPSSEAFSPGEACDAYREIISAYGAWLDPASVARTAKRRRHRVPRQRSGSTLEKERVITS